MLQCNFIFKPTHLNSAIEGGVLPEQNFYSDSVAGTQVTRYLSAFYARFTELWTKLSIFFLV